MFKVRECRIQWTRRSKTMPAITQPEHSVPLFRQIIGTGEPKEKFVAVFLDARNIPVGWEIISVGTATSALVHPREVFRAAVHLGAVSVIVGHNHPTGDPNPSAEDLAVTRRLVHAGDILGIKVLDHLVVTDDAHVSIMEQGRL